MNQALCILFLMLNKTRNLLDKFVLRIEFVYLFWLCSFFVSLLFFFGFSKFSTNAIVAISSGVSFHNFEHQIFLICTFLVRFFFCCTFCDCSELDFAVKLEDSFRKRGKTNKNSNFSVSLIVFICLSHSGFSYQIFPYCILCVSHFSD